MNETDQEQSQPNAEQHKTATKRPWWKTVTRYLVMFIGTVVVLMMVLSVLGIGIPVNFLKQDIERAVSDATGHNFMIDGELALVPGLTPSVKISGLHLDGPAGPFELELLSIGKLSAGVRLLPLLSSEIHVGEVSISDAVVRLLRIDDAAPRDQPDASPSVQEENTASAGEAGEVGGGFRLVALDALEISAFKLDIEDGAAGKSMSFVIDQALAIAPRRLPVVLQAKGSWQDRQWNLAVTGEDIGSVVDMDFPLSLQLEGGLAGIQGEVELTLDSLTAMDAVMEISGEDLAATGTELDMDLPAIQGYQVSAAVSYSGTLLQLSKIEVKFDDNQIDGAFSIDHGSSPMSVSSNLYARHVDFNPYLQEPVDDDQEVGIAPQADSAEDEASPADSARDAALSGISGLLAAFNTDIELGIDDLQFQGFRLHDSQVNLDLRDGVLDAPLQINLNEVPMTGKLQFAGRDDNLEFSAQLETRDSDLGQLEQWIGLDDIDGGFDQLLIRAGTRGDSVAALKKNLKADLELSEAQLTYGKEDPVAFSLGKLAVSAGVSNPLKVTAHGDLLGESFNLKIDGDHLAKLKDTSRWSMALQGDIAGAILAIEGAVTTREKKPSLELSLSLSGERIGDLAALTGFSANAENAYGAQARLTLAGPGWALQDLEFNLGSSTIKGNINASGTREERLFEAVIDAPVIDLTEINALFASDQVANADTRAAEQEPAQSFDINGILEMPIFPGGIEIRDADIDIAIGALVMESFDVDEIRFNGNFRGGKLLPAPFSMNFGGADFQGEMAFDSTLEMPAADLELKAQEIDIGGFLGEIGLAEGLEISARAMGLDIRLRGQKLGNILSNSEIRAYIESGEWVLTDPGSGGKLPLEIESGEFIMIPAQRIQLVQRSRIRGEAVTLQLEAQHPSEITDRVDISILLAHEETQMRLSGESMLPLKIENLVLKLDMSGENLASLSPVVGLRFPALGPYALSSSLSMSKEGYFLDQGSLRIGESMLEGKASLLTGKAVPQFNVDLVAEKIQLNDIRLKDEGKSGTDEAHASIEETEETTTANDETGQGETEAEPLFTADNLGLVNGTVSVRIDDVYSGDEWLGKGLLEFALQDSELRFEPISLDLPGGKFESALLVFPEEDEVRVNLRAQVDKFNYSALSKRIKPESDMTGLLYLDIDIDSRTRYMSKMIKNANGHFDFAVVPEEFESGIIDLWAVGLLTAILPKMGSDPSLVNCLIGRFDLEEGVMTEDLIILDTSKLRASGDATIDFKSQALEIKLVPQAKNPQIFRLEAPVKVEGEFANIGFNLKGGFLGSAARMVVTTIATPFKKMFGDDIPEDGSDLCTDPMARDPRE